MAVSVAGDKEAEAVVFGLISRGYKLVASLEQEVTGRLATVRLIPPLTNDAGVIVDLLFASCGIEPEVVAAATNENIARGVTGPVATVGYLIAMKTLSERDTRNQDRQDLIDLIRASSPADLEVARAGAALKGRSIAEIFAHLHNVRIDWLKSGDPSLVGGLVKLEKSALSRQGLGTSPCGLRPRGGKTDRRGPRNRADQGLQAPSNGICRLHDRPRRLPSR
ncbi:MAG: hypothetical protein C0506_10570 [Anaerolinea sp.]|nr:hypothetical protein [Anaerolinea sp.]